MKNSKMNIITLLLLATLLPSCGKGKSKAPIDPSTHPYVAAILNPETTEPEKLYIPQVFRIY